MNFNFCEMDLAAAAVLMNVGCGAEIDTFGALDVGQTWADDVSHYASLLASSS